MKFNVFICGEMNGENVKMEIKRQISLCVEDGMIGFCLAKAGHQSQTVELSHLKNADIVIALSDGLVNEDIPTILEVFEARRKNIPVLLYDPKNEIDKIHPWVVDSISIRTRTVQEIAKIISEDYVAGGFQ